MSPVFTWVTFPDTSSSSRVSGARTPSSQPSPRVTQKLKPSQRLKLTWAERIAGDLLHGHALAECAAVERRRVGAGSGPLLDAPPAWHVTGRPLRPQGPAAVHCREKKSELSLRMAMAP